jgi:hypothetical protein
MAFVVDGEDWRFDGLTNATVENLIEQFLDKLSDALESGETIWIGDDLQTRPVLGTRDLWSLRDVDSGISIDEAIWQELATYLSQTPRYADEQEWPPNVDDIELKIGEHSLVENADVAWAHHSVRAGRAVGCIGLTRSGQIATESIQGTALLHWISDSHSKAVFWRAAIEIEGNSQKDFARLAHLAYPDLFFYDQVLNAADDFSGGYYTNVTALKRYLEALNDHGHWVFTAPPPTISRDDTLSGNQGAPSAQLMQRRFEHLSLDIAPEKPNVYQNSHTRIARQIKLNNKTLYCEWHCKLQPHQNRIHIHAPTPESNDKVVIAIFTTHLPLP